MRAFSRILVEGIGGIGGVVAGELGRAGLEPVLVTGNATIAEAINRDGLRVTTPRGTFSQRARAHVSLADVPAGSRFELALLAMKADGALAAARATLPLLDDDGFLVAMQNGIVVDDLAAAVGPERVVPAIVGWGATMHAPGVCERTSEGALHAGELDGRASERLQALAALLSKVTPVSPSTNMRGVLWSKLAINCAINSPGALTGQTLGEMMAQPRVRRAVLGVYSEVVDTADALGVRLERVAANPRLLHVPPGAGPLVRALKDLVARVVGRRYAKLRSSSLQSLERGRRTEIDWLNGYVVARAREKGVAVPLNEALVRLVHEIERGERKIGPANLDDWLAAPRPAPAGAAAGP